MNNTKIAQIVSKIISYYGKEYKISGMFLLSILYFIERESYFTFNKFIFDDTIFICYDRFSDKSFPSLVMACSFMAKLDKQESTWPDYIKENYNANLNEYSYTNTENIKYTILTKEEISFIESVLKKYYSLSGKELVELVKSFPECNIKKESYFLELSSLKNIINKNV